MVEAFNDGSNLVEVIDFMVEHKPCEMLIDEYLKIQKVTRE